MAKKSVFVFLEILFLILIIFVFLFNPQMTGDTIFDLGKFDFNFSKIILFVFLSGLIFVFLLEKHLAEDEYIVRKGSYKDIDYKFCRAENDNGRVVLIAPGIGPKEFESNSSTKSLAEQLARKGISSISLKIQKDEKAPSPRRIVGDYLQMARLAKQEGYDCIHGVYGSSLSAGPALVVAGKLGVRYIALRSPLVYFHEIFDEAVANRGGNPKNALAAWKKKRRIKKGGSTIPFELYDQFARVDISKVVNRLKGAKIEIVHGSEDKMVPIKYAERAYEELKKAGADVRIDKIEGAGHDFEGSQQKYAIKRLRKSLT